MKQFNIDNTIHRDPDTLYYGASTATPKIKISGYHTQIITLLFVLFFYIIPNMGFAQESSGGQNTSSDDNFYELQEGFNAYVATLPEDSLNYEIKAFRRFEAFWENRVGIDDEGNPGSFSAYAKAIYELMEEGICVESLNPKPWELLGPTKYNKHAMGIVNAVWMDPNDNNIVFAGARRGGIWKSIDGGENWQNKTDNIGLPGIGIRDFAVSGNTMYAATGIFDGVNSGGYSAGVLKSVDGGDSWVVLESLLETIGATGDLTGLTDPFRASFTSVEIDPTNPQNVMAGTKRAVFKSTDGGSNWSASLVPVDEVAKKKNHRFINMNFPDGTGGSLFVSSRYDDKGIGGAELWRTDDFGLNWTELTGNIPSPDNFIEGFIENDWTLINGQGWEFDTAEEWVKITPTIVNQPYEAAHNISMTFANMNYNINFNYVLPPKTEIRIIFNHYDSDGNLTDFYEKYYKSNTGETTETGVENLSILTEYMYAQELVISVKSLIGYDATEPVELSNFVYSFESYDEFEIDVPEPNVIYVLAKPLSSEVRRVYKSTDNGESFSHVTNISLKHVQREGFEIADVNSNTFFAGGNVVKMYNGSSIISLNSSGVLNNTHTDVRAMQHFKKNGGDVLVIGNDGGVSVSFNPSQGNGSWESYNGNGLAITEFYGVGTSEMDANRFVAGAQDNQTYYKINNKWIKKGGGDGNISVIDPFNSNRFYAKSNKDIRVKKYNGSNIVSASPSTNSPPSNDILLVNRNMLMDPNIQDKLFVMYPGGCYTKIVNGVDDWNLITADLPNQTTFRGMDIYQQNSDIIYISNQGAYYDDTDKEVIYRSNDAGVTWNILARPPAAQWSGITDLVISPYNEDLVLLSHGGVRSLTGKGRVSRTEDAGATWTDWSKGLPRVPANSLAYQKGNDIVYLGTDAGVYFRHIDDTEASGIGWQCFNDGLPVCTVTDVDVNHCSQELVISTYGRGLWKTALIPMENLVITEDTDWDDNKDIYSNIVVTNNAWLTITDTINMAAGKSITIEPGARINLDGGTITNACGELWDGIYVVGNKNENQNTANQGYIEITNGATIENAYTGVRNWGKKADGGTDWNKTGGVILAHSSYFINNRWDVSFLSYRQFKQGTPKADQSEFIDCDFIDNDDFVYDSNPERSFGMWRVHNIRIKGCTFSDNRTGLENHEKSRGIESIDAYYTIDNSPDSISEFNNLKYAVQSYDYSSKSIVVQNTGFNCHRAVYLNGISDAKVNFNNFLVETQDLPNGEVEIIPQYGLYLDMCHNYQVEENHFDSDVATSESVGAVGVLVNNRHGEVSKIYNNIFDNFYVATEAVGQNKDGEDETGLEFRCNNYSNNKYDVFITPDYFNPGPVVGIAEFQGVEDGETDQLAGNLFGNNSPVLESNYKNKGEFLFYIHHKEASESLVVPFKYSNIDLHEVDAEYNPDLSCPLQNTGGGGDDEIKIAALKTTVETSIGEVFEIENQLATLVDGGNTEQMENDVVLTDNADAWKKYQELMTNAGYLSDEVLDEVSKKETGFNKAMVRNVLVANPQAAKSEKVQESLDNRGDQLPGYMRDQIDMGLTKMSAKEFLELQKATYQTRHDAAIDQLVSLLKSDTLNDRSAEIVTALSNTNDVGFEYKLVEYYDAIDQSYLADVLLDVINGYSLNENQQRFFDNYSAFRNLTAQWKQSGVNMAELDSTKLLELKAYSELNNSVAAKAIALQQLNGDYSYIEPIYDPEGGDKSNTDARRKKTVVNDNKLLLFPNPADGYFTIEYSLTEPFNKGVLVVFDISGRVIVQQEVYYEIDQVIIPSENWPAGQYTVSLFADKKTVMTKRITLSK